MDPSSESLRSGPGPDPSPGPGLPCPPAASSAAASESGSGSGRAGLPSDGSTTKHTPIVTADSTITASHLARFEFSELGTKILMVEWYPGVAALPTPADDLGPVPCPPSRKPASVALIQTSPADNTTSSTFPPSSTSPLRGVPAGAAAEPPEWNISWPGKSTNLPARETDEDGARRRVYFMLPDDVPVPGTVTVSRPGHQTLVLKPLPAIFPERLETTATTAPGPRGVLHALWAKRRLVELDREMESEMRTNAESVGLEMALAERQWIVENFLPAPPAAPPSCPDSAQALPHGPSRTVATTSKTHAPGRLGDKLKALRLATSPVGLAAGSMANTFTGHDLPSTPPSSDIAVSSFSALSLGNPVAAAAPYANGSLSLDSILHDGPIASQVAPQEEDDLFALPMSPRSPDMIKSPFSVLGTRPF